MKTEVTMCEVCNSKYIVECMRVSDVCSECKAGDRA